jgi:hypothetical protein
MSLNQTKLSGMNYVTQEIQQTMDLTFKFANIDILNDFPECPSGVQ